MQCIQLLSFLKSQYFCYAVYTIIIVFEVDDGLVAERCILTRLVLISVPFQNHPMTLKIFKMRLQTIFLINNPYIGTYSAFIVYRYYVDTDRYNFTVSETNVIFWKYAKIDCTN